MPKAKNPDIENKITELGKIYEELKKMGAIGIIMVVGYEQEDGYVGSWAKHGGEGMFVPHALHVMRQKVDAEFASKIKKIKPTDIN